MDKQIFKEIQALKRQILPNERVILFGSQARGDEHKESDWDLLVLLNKKERNFSEDFDKYSSPFFEVGVKYGTCIVPVIYTVNDWEKPSMLRYNVEREGIEIV